MSKIAGSFVVAVMLCTMPSFADEPVACSTDWGYGDTNGPNQWGQLNKAYSACDTGPLQAPVKLDSPTVPAPYTLTASYVTSAVTVQHTAHDMNVFALGASNRLTYGAGVTAVLNKFHFHRPSEHPGAEAELHLVHLDTNNRGYVIAILIDAGGSVNNPAIDALLKLYPRTACTSAKSNEIPLAALLVPTDHWTKYTGSLTTPACDPGITFFVMTRHLTIPRLQLNDLMAVAEEARPTQPPNGRTFEVR